MQLRLQEYGTIIKRFYANTFENLGKMDKVQEKHR